LYLRIYIKVPISISILLFIALVPNIVNGSCLVLRVVVSIRSIHNV